MKKSTSSKLALSMAMGLLASTAVTAAMAADATQGLFGMNEVSQPIQIAAGDHKCGKDAKCGKEGGEHKCGKEGDHHCGKDHKHKKGEAECASKTKDAKCGGKSKEAKCGAGSCGGKTKK